MNNEKEKTKKKIKTKKGSKLKKGLSSVITKLKLQTAKLGTNISLAILSKPNKVELTNFELDIPYAGKKDEINDFQKLDIFYPLENNKPLPIIFFIHGGAWSSGNKSYYGEFCQKLCKQDFIVVNINYRLIPDFTLNDIVNDCKKAINFALKKHKKYKIDLNNIFMIGDSAGAHLCALLAGIHSTKETKYLKDIRALSLYYGAYDLSTFNVSSFSILKTLDKYFKGIIYDNKLKAFYHKFSPTTYVSSSFPPTLLIAGKVDKLYEQSANFEQKLIENSAECQTLFFPKNRKDALHGFLNFTKSESSQTAFDKTIEFFKSHIK